MSLALSVLDLKWPRFLCSSFHQEVCFPRPAMWASKVTRFDQHKVREHWQAASCRALLKYRGLWRGLGAALSGWQALRSDSQHHHTCEGPCLGHSAQPHVVRWRSCHRDPRQGLQIGPPEPSPNCQHRRSSFPHPHNRLPRVWELSPYPFYYLFCLKHSACLRWSLFLRHGFWTLYVPGHSSLDTFKVAKFLFKLCGSRNWKQCFKDDLLLLTLRVFLLFPTASSPLTSPRALASSSLSCPCLSPSPKRQQFSHPSGTKSNLHHSFASLSPAPDPFSQRFAGPAFSFVRCAGWLLWLGHEFLESSYFLYLNASPGTWHMSGAQ